MTYDMTKPRANNNTGFFMVGKCYRCDCKSVTVVTTNHPRYKRMCKNCREELAKKKPIATQAISPLDKSL